MTRRIVVLTAALVGLVSAVLALLAAPAQAATPVPPTPAGLPTAIEPLTYVGQTTCDPHVWPGTKALATLLATTYRSDGATSWASAYACGTDSPQSEHYEGRAIDWMTSVHNAKQRAAATSAIAWLLATDRAGNPFAMARRLGVMYIIWNNRIWGSWDGRWDSYNGCSTKKSSAYDNACHRTHVHISLSWNGAMKRTSYWTKKVAAYDYGPCRAADLNWAYLYTGPNLQGCPPHTTVTAPKGASTLKKTLVTYSGAPMRSTWTGPIVTAVQQALHVRATGRYDAATVAAVRRFQTSHHCSVTGAMNQGTWRALLKAVH
jgi:hypothetical protein